MLKEKTLRRKPLHHYHQWLAKLQIQNSSSHVHFSPISTSMSKYNFQKSERVLACRAEKRKVHWESCDWGEDLLPTERRWHGALRDAVWGRRCDADWVCYGTTGGSMSVCCAACRPILTPNHDQGTTRENDSALGNTKLQCKNTIIKWRGWMRKSQESKAKPEMETLRGR